MSKPDAPGVKPGKKASRSIITVILIFGVISLLGDMVYESARGANSQYFSLLGVNAAAIGLAFGIGEFLGYALRLLAGVWSDRTGRHWLFIFAGYGLLIAVPMMGFTRHWNLLVVLVLMERVGKALRNPAKDTLLSSVAQGQVGVGFAFGLQEALDQVGAFLGPLIFTLIFTLTARQGPEEYSLGYQLLLIPFAALMVFVYFAWRRITRENLVPRMRVEEYRQERLPPLFWQYTLFTFVCTLGFVSFSIIGFHAKDKAILTDAEIPLFYAIAMAVDAVSALLIGRWYDLRKKKSGRQSGGLFTLAALPLASLLLPFLTLSGNRAALIAGLMLFGVVMGAHETVMRSAIADISPFYKRGMSYGIFNAAYGLALMIGAWGMGLLYDANLVWMILVITVVLESAALWVFFQMQKRARSA
ncbi:MAG: MFS transporter [Eubacteriales bacterium]|nr:MFS transporter [Eubacteriales bacterium]